MMDGGYAVPPLNESHTWGNYDLKSMRIWKPIVSREWNAIRWLGHFGGSTQPIIGTVQNKVSIALIFGVELISEPSGLFPHYNGN